MDFAKDHDALTRALSVLGHRLFRNCNNGETLAMFDAVSAGVNDCRLAHQAESKAKADRIKTLEARNAELTREPAPASSCACACDALRKEVAHQRFLRFSAEHLVKLLDAERRDTAKTVKALLASLREAGMARMAAEEFTEGLLLGAAVA